MSSGNVTAARPALSGGDSDGYALDDPVASTLRRPSRCGRRASASRSPTSSCAVKKMVREFAEAEIAPARDGVGRGAGLPARGRREARRARDARASSSPRSTAAPGSRYVDYVNVVEELSRVDGSVGISVAAHNSLCTNHLYLFGTEEQKRRWVVPLAQGKAHRRLGPDRGRGRERRRGTKTTAVLDGNALGPERLEELHHPRLGRRRGGPDGRHRQDAGHARHLGLRRRPPPAGHPRREEGEQAGPARLRHGDARHGGLPHPEGEPDRRTGRGLRPGDEGPRRRADLDRRARPRDGAGRLRVRARLLQASASSSASRSPSSSRSRTTSPTWRRRSTPRAS